MRVHELAKELGVKSKDILDALEEMGLGGSTASSSVPDSAVPRLRASGGKPVPGGAKPKDATEEQQAPAPRKKPKAKVEAKAEPKAEQKVEPKTQSKAPTEPKKSAKSPIAQKSAAPTPPVEAAPPAAVADVVTLPEAVPADVGAPAAAQSDASLPILKLAPGVTAQEIADKTSRTAADVIMVLFQLGEMATAAQSLSEEAAELIASELGYRVEWHGVEDEDEYGDWDDGSEGLEAMPRPPVVTVMGHVDHGKTLLLDSIRKTDVVAGEFGGITQHIGAYQVHLSDRLITFIDTPGHEAFTAMRARGAQVTDVAILVVAADDGVMPQTVEALSHAKAAGVPIIVAVNKVDKEAADPNRVRQQFTEHEMIPVEWGGTAEFVDVSAKSGQGLDKLLETVLIVAELEDLKAVPGGRSRGAVIEAHLDKGRGPVATVLVQRGTLEVGDALVSGSSWCRVRALHDENGDNVEHAGPSKAVEVIGWNTVPEAGDDFRELSDEREARHHAQEREARQRAAQFVSHRPLGLADLIAATRESEITELNIIVKADVQGSLEALKDQLSQLPRDEVRARVIHGGVGAVTESDIDLALASGAIVVGFNVRPQGKAKELADREGVDLRLYRVIYELLDDIRSALSGMLTPDEVEAELGTAQVRATFKVPKVGMAAGCMVTKGAISRGARARLVRDGVVVYDGEVETLRRFKDDAKEVREGFECGIGLKNFQDVKEGDLIESYEVREVARSL